MTDFIKRNIANFHSPEKFDSNSFESFQKNSVLRFPPWILLLLLSIGTWANFKYNIPYRTYIAYAVIWEIYWKHWVDWTRQRYEHQKTSKITNQFLGNYKFGEYIIIKSNQCFNIWLIKRTFISKFTLYNTNLAGSNQMYWILRENQSDLLNHLICFDECFVMYDWWNNWICLLDQLTSISIFWKKKKDDKFLAIIFGLLWYAKSFWLFISCFFVFVPTPSNLTLSVSLHLSHTHFFFLCLSQHTLFIHPKMRNWF